MRIVSIPPSRCKQAVGFTLIELLLAVFLLTLLFGALVFNFTNLQPGAELAEGAERFESLLRFARAHAAFSGCRVQVCFESEDIDPFAPSVYRLRLTWEPDPWDNPGAYVDLLPSAWDLEGINETVRVEQVSHPTALGPSREGIDAASTSAPQSEDEFMVEPISALGSEPELDSSEEPSQSQAEAPPPITFFPDGSSDSVQVLLAARSPDDPRQVIVHLAGITGSISREWIVPEPALTTEAELDWIDEFLEEMAAPEPLL